jgi:hypothetical protein
MPVCQQPGVLEVPWFIVMLPRREQKNVKQAVYQACQQDQVDGSDLFQYAPLPRSVTHTVFSNIFMSKKIE